MEFRVQKKTELLDAPNGQQIDVLTVNKHLIGTGQTSGEFTEVTTDNNKRGFVKTADISPIGAQPLPVLNEGDFVAQCASVEGAINDVDSIAPWFVSADYLIACSVIQTDLANVAAELPESGATGPLQMTAKQWDEFLKSGIPIAAEFKQGDFKNAILQVFGAAFRMHANAKAISALKTPAGSNDPFVPNYLNLLHADLTGSVKAAVAIFDAALSDTDKGKTIDVILKTALSDAETAGVVNAYRQFTGAEGQPKTVTDFVHATDSALNSALQRAYDLLQQFVPEVLVTVKQGEAPWFDVAQNEEAAGVAEPNKRILEYFKATDLKPQPTSTDTPWCGAFAAFCMAQSGSTVAASSIPKGSARAANWKNWGTQLPVKSPDIPQGAVVVLSPGEGTGGSGHVGFFVTYAPDGKTVQLLGGNQSNSVKYSNFSVSRIAAINWLDLGPTTTQDQNDAQASDLPISKAAFDLIVEFEVTSEAVYRKKYFAPEWPGFSSGVTIGIGYDVGQTKASVFESDWKGIISDNMYNALLQTVGVTGPAAKPLAARLKSVVNIPWEKALQVHTNRVIPRWVAWSRACWSIRTS